MEKISLLVKFAFASFVVALLSIFLVLFVFGDQLSILAKLILILSNLTFVILILYLGAKTRESLNYFSFFADTIASGNLDTQVNRKLTSEFSKTAISLEKMRLALRDQVNTLEEQKNRAEAVVFNVGEGVFAVNLKGEIIVFNQIAEKIVGLKKELIAGQKYDQILQFFNSKTRESYGSFINKVLLEGKSVSLPDTILITANKAEIPVAVNSSPIRNQKGIIVGGIVVFRDITHEREIEEIRNDLISIASHQLRTPLSEIRGLITLLVDNIAGPLTPKQKEYLDLITVANERMINLVNDLLNISRIEQGRIQLNFQKVNLGTLTTEICKSLEIQAKQKKQILSLTLDQNLPAVVADPEKTKEIISNLVENALKYTYDSGTISVRVTAAQGGCWVLVKDSGVGIPKEKQKELFQKFSRLENPLSQKTTGTGLGLYAVKQLVEKQNGRVWVESTEGKGSTFGFVLPIVKN
jgi:PAS domain S-box-containing protein